jgi:hypothetical protein
MNTDEAVEQFLALYQTDQQMRMKAIRNRQTRASCLVMLRHYI